MHSSFTSRHHFQLSDRECALGGLRVCVCEGGGGGGVEDGQKRMSEL